MKKLEPLTYENVLGQSVTFSHADIFCPQEVKGLKAVQQFQRITRAMG